MLARYPSFASVISADESFSWRVIHQEWGDIVLRVAADGHPPGYFLVLKLWSAIFGTELWALRSLSLVCAGATCIVSWRTVSSPTPKANHPKSIARGKTTVGIVLALLGVAAHPSFLASAATARMYPLGCLLAALVAYGMVLALRSPTQYGPYLLVAVAACAWMYVHHLALVGLAGIFGSSLLVWALRVMPGEECHRFLGRLWISGLGALALYSPWVATLLRQSDEVYRSFWIPPVTLDEFGSGFVAWLTGIVPSSLFATLAAAISALVLAVSFAWMLPALAGTDCRDGPLRAFALLMLGATIAPWLVCFVLTFFLGRPLFQDRYFLFAYLNFVLFCAAIASLARWPKSATVFFGTLLVSNLTGNVLEYLDRRAHPEPDAAAIAAVISGARAGDIVVVDWPSHLNQLLYELDAAQRRDVRVYCQGPFGGARGHVGHLAACEYSDVLMSPQELVIGSSRLWTLSISESGHARFRERTELMKFSTFGEGDRRRYVALLQGVEP